MIAPMKNPIAGKAAPPSLAKELIIAKMIPTIPTMIRPATIPIAIMDFGVFSGGSRFSPQKRHFFAMARISSPQAGQRLLSVT